MPVAPSAYALTPYRRQRPELHKTLYDYVTLFDVYECAINPALLAQRIEDGEQRMSTHYILIELEAYSRTRTWIASFGKQTLTRVA